MYMKLQKKVLNGETNRYWLEDDLLYFKGGQIFVPSSGA